MAYFTRHHAWVAAYAPYDDPQIAVAVFVEHGGGGGAAAGPITMEIISRYFDIFGAQTTEPSMSSSLPQGQTPRKTGPLGAPDTLLGGLP